MIVVSSCSIVGYVVLVVRGFKAGMHKLPTSSGSVEFPEPVRLEVHIAPFRAIR